MPFNGFLGPSSKQAVLTRILRHPAIITMENNYTINQKSMQTQYLLSKHNAYQYAQNCPEDDLHRGMPQKNLKLLIDFYMLG